MSVRVVAVSVLVVVGVLAGLYEWYVPGRVVDVAGSVTSNEVFTNESGPRYFVYVRLDRGDTIRARVDRYVSIRPGDRVVLVQVASPLLGWRRYRYKRPAEAGKAFEAPATRRTEGDE